MIPIIGLTCFVIETTPLCCLVDDVPAIPIL
jgi:hypothetical protein